ncbi:L-ribulose-5-phosphate 4-epimerase [Ruminococcus sp. YE71]|uniref:L-ribulose-5-phosphate 4-epimerase n=1 Tax=unclassified Ruminococcus TaxID=2608920 RepID=UPI00088F2C18|nr:MULTISPECIES: L-ribulose-5-phosphate 4-epimerase [unclassified Ruminococcus]SDA27630.1 L-ribulose-5-phosphate 4-epimerase [Ruminococcus sp. YE78]SFW45819.1 L-ribulose-5-phosphate 4-epimerase [Ruminococcus sp. YE71]
MLEQLKQEVFEANIELMRRKVVIYTWGNVSGIDREKGLMVIKPSGIDYDRMSARDMVVIDIRTGEKVDGKWRPSSDTATHIELYRKYPQIGGITHTHSVNAVAFAQAGRDIPALGTTHADYFYGPIPCTRSLTKEEVEKGYEKNTGKVIIETLEERGIEPLAVPGIVVRNHGPFTWGRDAAASVYHAVVMDTVAEMTMKTLLLNPSAEMPQYILDKHYYRKHGKNAYYGQK